MSLRICFCLLYWLYMICLDLANHFYFIFLLYAKQLMTPYCLARTILL